MARRCMVQNVFGLRTVPSGAEADGQMFKIILKLEEERVPGKNARGEGGIGSWRFTAQKGVWNYAKKRMLEDRGALPKEEGDLIM